MALRYSGKYDDAIEADLKVINLKEDDFFTWNELGVLYSEKNEHEKALECFNKSISIQPDDPQLYINLADVLIKQGREKEIKNFLNPLLTKPEVKKKVDSILKENYPLKFDI